MEDLGYDTHNAILILGTMGIILAEWALLAITCLVLKLIEKYSTSERISNFRKKI
jgi:hypothetical protein